MHDLKILLSFFAKLNLSLNEILVNLMVLARFIVLKHWRIGRGGGGRGNAALSV